MPDMGEQMLGVEPGTIHRMIREISGSGRENLKDRHRTSADGPAHIDPPRMQKHPPSSSAGRQATFASFNLCAISLACKLSTISSISPSMKRSRL